MSDHLLETHAITDVDEFVDTRQQIPIPGRPENPTVGILYPGHAAEDDYPAFEEACGGAVRLPVTHTTIGVDEHTTQALLETGSPARLAEGAQRLLAEHPVEALMWACTSGSFVYGFDGAHDQTRTLEQAAGVPTSSTSLAYLHALQTLGVRRVAVAASYPADLAEHFQDLLGRAGVDVVAFASHGIFTAAEVGLMGREDVVAMIRAVDVPQAEAMLVPDTAMHSLRWIPDLEESLGKPVLTANQVTVWEGLRLTGRPMPVLPQLGCLGDPNVWATRTP
ncbi:maleate cis-trans isomerase [Nesterenkonia sp. CL21]|uniref:maleate cis-trans isomerase family protein n=1 Tax=Nesterenkonia sp. CL21 TaxID=3064894 RepID=UPI0028799E7F|nr:maleate cis-trans isomerase [Nesterenkonia sp. CL21]MDS2173221.1 maleate cis-trans isomerase [Nesterenkonia sp. CL21]